MVETSKIINDAISFILTNLDGSITADEVASHCHISGSYFNKLFKDETGESVYAYIKKKKLEFSAFMIKSQSTESITDIASSYGYSSSNYSSAFKDYFQKSPAEFRSDHFGKNKELFNESNSAVREVYDEMCKLITVCTLPDYPVIYERYIGSYDSMKKSWKAFTSKYEPFTTSKTVFYERTYDDPTIADENKCLYDICMSIESLPKDFEAEAAKYLPGQASLPNFGTIIGGKFAVCHFKGYISEINDFHHKLMSIWFPLSGNLIDFRYSFDRYYCVDCESYYMEFDICIPIK